MFTFTASEVSEEAGNTDKQQSSEGENKESNSQTPEAVVAQSAATIEENSTSITVNQSSTEETVSPIPVETIGVTLAEAMDEEASVKAEGDEEELIESNFDEVD